MCIFDLRIECVPLYENVIAFTSVSNHDFETEFTPTTSQQISPFDFGNEYPRNILNMESYIIILSSCQLNNYKHSSNFSQLQPLKSDTPDHRAADATALLSFWRRWRAMARQRANDLKENQEYSNWERFRRKKSRHFQT